MRGFNQKLMLMVVLLSIAVISITVGFSYAYIVRSSASSNSISVETGVFGSNVTFSYTSGDLTAMDDASGLAQSAYSVVTIDGTNNEYTTYYELGIGYDMSNAPSGTTASALLPLEFVRVAVYSMNGTTLSSSPVVGPIAITDVPMQSIDTSNFLNDLYRLHYGFFASGATTKFALKFWLDDDTPIEYDGKLAYLNVEVKEQAKQAINLYNLPTTVKCNGTTYTGTGYFDGRPIDFSNNTQVNNAFSNVPEGAHVITACSTPSSKNVLLMSNVSVDGYSMPISSSDFQNTIQETMYISGSTVSQFLLVNPGLNSLDVPSGSGINHTSFIYMVEYPPLAAQTDTINKNYFNITSSGITAG